MSLILRFCRSPEQTSSEASKRQKSTRRRGEEKEMLDGHGPSDLAGFDSLLAVVKLKADPAAAVACPLNLELALDRCDLLLLGSGNVTGRDSRRLKGQFKSRLGLVRQRKLNGRERARHANCLNVSVPSPAGPLERSKIG